MTPKLHAALNVDNLEESLVFCRALSGVEPVKVRRWDVFVALEDNPPEVAEPEARACCAVGEPEMVRIGGL